MIYALLTLVFIALATLYVQFEVHDRKIAWRDNLEWAAAAVILPLIGSILSIVFGGKLGNFLLHSIGGGMATTCVFEYVRRLAKIHINWRLSLIGTFMLAAALGVINELAEYAAELLHAGTFSFDTHDTWRDLAANSVGALVAWLLIVLIIHRSNHKKS